MIKSIIHKLTVFICASFIFLPSTLNLDQHNNWNIKKTYMEHLRRPLDSSSGEFKDRFSSASDLMPGDTEPALTLVKDRLLRREFIIRVSKAAVFISLFSSQILKSAPPIFFTAGTVIQTQYSAAYKPLVETKYSPRYRGYFKFQNPGLFS